MAENNSEEGHHTVTDSDGRAYQVQATPGSGQTVHTCRAYILANPMQIEYFVQLDRLMNERRIDADRHRIVKLLEEPGALVDFDILIDRINAPHECDYGGAIASK